MNSTPIAHTHFRDPVAVRSKTDPILLELWEIKRQINAEAHYDIAELARRANAFNLELALKQIGVSSKAEMRSSA